MIAHARVGCAHRHGGLVDTLRLAGGGAFVVAVTDPIRLAYRRELARDSLAPGRTAGETDLTGFPARVAGAAPGALGALVEAAAAVDALFEVLTGTAGHSPRTAVLDGLGAGLVAGGAIAAVLYVIIQQMQL